ncbi:unnamed protein product [Moneuplotes crassus]|uniref:Transmembrane protein n=1 Tax=Euplotes crassus TaxID=5936 RepID=A0AAD1YA73_EUPCR|nr:unnamed protein product [Moneuplotes crassus]
MCEYQKFTYKFLSSKIHLVYKIRGFVEEVVGRSGWEGGLRENGERMGVEGVLEGNSWGCGFMVGILGGLEGIAVYLVIMLT